MHLKWRWAASRTVINCFPTFTGPCDNFLKKVSNIPDESETSFKGLRISKSIGGAQYL